MINRLRYKKYIMESLELNTSIVSCYIGLLANLGTDNKLELISQLSALVKTDIKKAVFI